MNVSEFYEIQKLPDTQDYQLADNGGGFVVPGHQFLASISPSEAINYIALLRYVKGQQRANHYHKQKIEHLVVLDGVIKVQLYAVGKEDDSIEFEIRSGDVLTIRPGCNHTLTAQTETAAVLELSPQKLDLSDQFSPNVA